MMSVDWSAVILGLAVGAVMSALFFAGLGLGMRLALRTQNSIRILSLSAALRIAALLGMGWAVVGQGGPWAFLGYGVAFFAVRFISMTVARVGAPAGDAP